MKTLFVYGNNFKAAKSVQGLTPFLELIGFRAVHKPSWAFSFESGKNKIIFGVLESSADACKFQGIPINKLVCMDASIDDALLAKIRPWVRPELS